jgi:hypothetical protein
MTAPKRPFVVRFFWLAGGCAKQRLAGCGGAIPRAVQVLILILRRITQVKTANFRL